MTADHRPHAVPCCFALVGDVVYTAVDDVKAKRSTALRRVDNVRANGAASLLVDHYADDWSALWWVRVDGNARVLDVGEERSARSTRSPTSTSSTPRAAHRAPWSRSTSRQWRAWP